jgi:hypothetical protein
MLRIDWIGETWFCCLSEDVAPNSGAIAIVPPNTKRLQQTKVDFIKLVAQLVNKYTWLLTLPSLKGSHIKERKLHALKNLSFKTMQRNI